MQEQRKRKKSSTVKERERENKKKTLRINYTCIFTIGHTYLDVVSNTIQMLLGDNVR